MTKVALLAWVALPATVILLAAPTLAQKSRSLAMPSLSVPGFLIEDQDDPEDLASIWTVNHLPIFHVNEQRSSHPEPSKVRVQAVGYSASGTSDFNGSPMGAFEFDRRISFQGGRLQCIYNIDILYAKSSDNVVLKGWDICKFNDVNIQDGVITLEQGKTYKD